MSAERHVLDLLHSRYSQEHGNGRRYAVAEHVKNAGGFDANRVCDFMAMDCWPSTGLLLHGHEVKCSRADWLAELRQPAKAEAFLPYVNCWWLVVSDAGIVRDDLPDGWGLMVAGRASVRMTRDAAVNAAPLPLPPGMLAALLRATTKTAERRLTTALAGAL